MAAGTCSLLLRVPRKAQLCYILESIKSVTFWFMESKPVPAIPQALPCPLGQGSRQEPAKAKSAVPGHGDKSMWVFFRLCLVRAPSMAFLCLVRVPSKAFPLFHHRLAAG